MSNEEAIEVIRKGNRKRMFEKFCYGILNVAMLSFSVFVALHVFERNIHDYKWQIIAGLLVANGIQSFCFIRKQIEII